MTKADLVNKLVEHGMARSTAMEAVAGVVDSLAEALISGETILRGLGTFKVCVAKEKIARNISAGSAITVPAHKLKTYTGTKTIKAMPMGASEAKHYGAQITEETIQKNIGNDGYLVEYPDGYRSWSPKKAFEDAYKVSETPLDRMTIELSDLVERIKEATTMRYDIECNNRAELNALDEQIGGMEHYADMLYRRIKIEQERHGRVVKDCAISCAGKEDTGE